MAGRTLLQQALPITFGLKAAGWMTGLDDAAARLDDVRRDAARGAAGRRGGDAGGARRRRAGRARRLGRAGSGCAAPVLPWHTDRTRVAELAGALGAAAGAAARPPRDVVLLAQTEVGEVREGGAGRGGSSTMPHKRNPVAAVRRVAAARRAPGLVATMLAAMRARARARRRRLARGVAAAAGAAASPRLGGRVARATASSASWSTPTRMRANLGADRRAAAGGARDDALAPALGRRPRTTWWRRPRPRRRRREPGRGAGRAAGGHGASLARARSRPCSIRRATSAAPGLRRPRARSARGASARRSGRMSAPVPVTTWSEGPADAPGARAVGVARLHGSAMWDPQLDALAAAFRVVRYDLRGHGGSPVPAGPYDDRRSRRRPDRAARPARGRARAPWSASRSGA